MIHSLIQTAYPQALAKLLYLIRDIHNAEDYLQSAVEQALIKWPEQQPDNCVGWLVKVAQNKFIDEFRRSKKQLSSDLLEEVYEDIDLSEQSLLISYNDDILRLIFTSCHPALNQETQIALSLKHVLGLSVSEIGSALLIPKKTIQQRLLRAKKKIAATNIPYEIPKPSSWNDRLSGVLKTIYLLFNEGYLST
ncbi:MAG: sigma-70 family RNA polymerase sigma factor, partial [Kangiellaceae bacterium]|nr:sigma-70 family RNA polymerase sigma factor [Kangiellaceae bacterium]